MDPLKSATSNRTEYHTAQINRWSLTANVSAFREGASCPGGIGMAGTGQVGKGAKGEAIWDIVEVECAAANAIFSSFSSLSTVCEISSESITEQSCFSFSFNGTNTTSTHSLRLRLSSNRVTLQGKQNSFTLSKRCKKSE